MMTGLVLIYAAAAPGAFADLAAIDRQVAMFTGAAMGEEGGAAAPVDRRLRLRPCGSGLALSWRTAARDSVLVQCGDTGGWRLFVPTRRAVPASLPVPQEPAVRRGDAVVIAVEEAGFSVSQPGEALEGGTVGEWIRVRPLALGKGRPAEMRARIERPGLVSLPLP